MYIQTVRGPITPDMIGITLAHEHIFLDFRCVWTPPPAGISMLGDAEINAQTLLAVRKYPHSVRRNLVLDDMQLAISETSVFRQLGGNTIVELTNIGLGPQPLKLLELSNSLGINIVAGCGYYRHIAQSESVLTMKADELSENIVKSLEEGIEESDVRAGIIGEVGTSFPLHPFERESLLAAANAQAQTGVAINVHPDIWGRGQLEILKILELGGADLNRTVISHMDEITDSKLHLEVARRGVYLSFDTFGSEFDIDGVSEPRDEDRINCLLTLLEHGYVDKVLLSHDVCYQIQLSQNGGRGYGYLISSIVPTIKRQGVSSVEIDKMLTENPARLLAI